MEREAYRIIKWRERHSNYEQMRSGGRWIACPTSFDSLGLRSLLRDQRGVTAFGVYVLIAELAARMPTPGVLANEDGPLTTAKIALVTGVPTRVVGAALQRLESDDVNWLDRVPFPDCLPDADSGDDSSGTPTDDQRNATEGVRSLACARAAAAASSASASVSRGGVGEMRADQADPGRLVDVLRTCGVPQRRAEQVAQVDGLSVGHIAARWWDVQQRPNVKRPGSYMATALLQDGVEGCEPLTAEAVYQAVGEGLIRAVRVGDQTVELAGRELGHNGRGLYVDGDLAVATEQLADVEWL